MTSQGIARSFVAGSAPSDVTHHGITMDRRVESVNRPLRPTPLVPQGGGAKVGMQEKSEITKGVETNVVVTRVVYGSLWKHPPRSFKPLEAHELHIESYII